MFKIDLSKVYLQMGSYVVDFSYDHVYFSSVSIIRYTECAVCLWIELYAQFKFVLSLNMVYAQSPWLNA